MLGKYQKKSPIQTLQSITYFGLKFLNLSASVSLFLSYLEYENNL